METTTANKIVIKTADQLRPLSSLSYEEMSECAKGWPWTFEELSQDTYADLLSRGVDFERMDDDEAVGLFSWFDNAREVAFRVVGGGNVMWVVR